MRQYYAILTGETKIARYHMYKHNIILASSSPRRIEMMKSNGINPMVIPAKIKENTPLYDGKTETCMFLALKKALAVEEGLSDEQKSDCPYILAADTVVYSDKIIGKPHDKADALEILMSLSGKAHYVVTGVAILKAGTTMRTVFSSITKVYFKEYTAEDIAAYLETDEPYDKAGAYAIQGYFGRYVDHYEGSLNNVIGFPLEQIIPVLEEMQNENL